MTFNEESNSAYPTNDIAERLPLGRRDYLKYAGTAVIGSLAATGGVVADDTEEDDEEKEAEYVNLPTNLRVEYAEDPVDLDVTRPRLSWDPNVEGQSAYQIQVTSMPDGFDRPDIWDSGRVKSDRAVNVEYDGPALDSGIRYYWQVRV